MRITNFLFGAAIILMPVSYAVKSLLQLENIIWINPSLLLTVAALLLLIPRWGDFLNDDLRPISLCSLGFALATVPAMISGFLLRPTPFAYNVLREPIRLWLLLLWMITACWFLRYNPRLVFRCTAIAIFFALLTGLYMYGVVPGWLPANPITTAYARAYFLRQAIWITAFPIPRMGGLFVEAPPFGLFMFSSTIVLLCGWKLGMRPSLLRWGIWISILGVLLSLTDQILLGAIIGLGLALPSFLPKKQRYVRLLLFIALAIPGGLVWHSLSAKTNPFPGATSVIFVNGNSAGERIFHTHYGFSLLTMDGRAVPFGIGPGRYGEYVTETGYYPDTVTMQFSLMEILCEWGAAGVAIIGGICLIFFSALSKASGIFGAGLFLGLLIADSFQANWKWEGAFLAIAALYTVTISQFLRTRQEEQRTSYSAS